MGKASKIEAEVAEVEQTQEEIDAQAKAERKAAKKAAKAAAALVAAQEEEVAEAPKEKKKRKKAEAAEEEQPELVEEAEAPKEKKKKKKAGVVEEQQEEAEAEKAKKEKKKKHAEVEAEAPEEEAPKEKKKKQKKAEAEDDVVADETPKKKQKSAETAADETPPKAKAEAETKVGEEENHTVFVGGIPFSCDEATLRKDFGECGEIEKINLPMNDEGRPKGIAFITYKTAAGVEAACKFDGEDYGGRTLKVNKAGEKGKGGDKGKGKGEKGKGGSKGNNELTVCVRGLPFATTEEALKKDFAECGELERCKMLLNDEGTCKGVAFIEYKTKEGVEKACAFHETDYGGRTIYVSPAGENGAKGKDGKDKGKGKDGKGGGKGNNELTVCVRGLPFATTEEALKKDFGECGELERCKMILNDEGQCKGTAFIEYKTKEALEKACKFNETDYGGRTIYVSPAGEGGGKGKDGKDKGKGKGKDKGKGKKGKATSEAKAKSSGAMVASTGEKKSFDSDSE